MERPDYAELSIRDLAATCARQAEAIESNTLVGPRLGAARLLLSNVQMLVAWLEDDEGV